MTAPKLTIDESVGRIGATFGVDDQTVLADVRANLTKLKECELHTFLGVDETAIRSSDGTRTLYRDYRCKHCGGKVT